MFTSKNRRLAAILFADIVGYTALMQADEPQALTSLQKFKTVLEKQVPANKGTIIQFYGDGCLAIFDSSVDAVTCAKNLQFAFQTAPTVPVRISLHAGDVVFRDDNVFGNAVNIASRIESMGVPGAVLLSSSIRNQIKNQPALELMSLGRFEFKNVAEGMTVYALKGENLVIPKKEKMKGKGRAKIISPLPKSLIWPLILFAAISIGIGLLSPVLWKQKKQMEALPKQKEISIAVLPFKNLGEDKDLNYFNVGIREDLSTQLIRIKALNVYSTEVANQYKSSIKTAVEIGKEMKVEYLLEGNSRIEDEQRVVTLNYCMSQQENTFGGITLKKWNCCLPPFKMK